MKAQSYSEHVVVILGAGSSAPVVPTAAELTNLILFPDQSVDPVYAELFTWINKNMQSGGNFESLMMECLRRANDPQQRPKDVELYLKAVTEGARAIGREIAQRAANNQKTTPLVELLSHIIPKVETLTVGTINWDDLPLHNDNLWNWYDGFNSHVKSDGRFSSKFLDEYQGHPHRLYWLHGSLFWHRPFPNIASILVNMDDSPLQEWGFLWGKNAVDGWEGYNTTENGYKITLPVVIGANKPEQIFESPWFDYWTALYHDLRHATSIVMIGYSGRDTHLNMLVKDAVRYNAALRHLVWINYGNEPLVEITLQKTLPWVWDYPFVGVSAGHPDSDGFYKLDFKPHQNLHQEAWAYMLGIGELVSQSSHMQKLLDILTSR